MERVPLKTCPRCEEPRILAPECPRCGVLYARAQPRPARAAPVVAPPAAPSGPEPLPRHDNPLVWERDVQHARAEWNLRRFGLPGMLLAVWALDSLSLIQFGFGILGMFLHELGHATTAWFCGFSALPSLWVTSIAPTRSPYFLGMLTFCLTGLVLRGVLTGQRLVRDAGLVGLALQFVGSVLLTSAQARPLITFGGDGGALVLGALLMTSLQAPRESALRRGQLHWGLAFIGAASFVSTWREWWAARRDEDAIPFGEIEGVGLSDSSKLVDLHGWSADALVQRYLGLGLACLVGLAVVYALGLRRARATRRALERAGA